MEKIEIMVVCIGLDGQDDNIVKITGHLAGKIQPKRVSCVYISEHHYIPNAILNKYPELVQEIEDTDKDRITRQMIDSDPVVENVPVEFVSGHGNVLDEILRNSKELDADLIVMGRRRSRVLSGALQNQVIRRANCNVLIVPDGDHDKIRSILVGVDFSKHSVEAVQAAITIAAACKLPSIRLMHGYEVPIGFTKTGKNLNEFSKIMRDHAREQYDKLMTQINTQGILIKPVFVETTNISEEICESAINLDIDLIVLGTQGHGAGVSALMGSVTTNVIRASAKPVLVVKQKGVNSSLLEKLFS